MTENAQMETSLNGIGSAFKALDGFKTNLMPALVGAAGAGVGLYGMNMALGYGFIPAGAGQAPQSIDTFLVSKAPVAVKPYVPGALRVALAVAAVPLAFKTVRKYAGEKLAPRAAEGAAVAVVALFGVTALAAAAGVKLPGALQLGGFGGAQLSIDSPSQQFGGASLSAEEVGKFGGIGGANGPGFRSVVGMSASY